MAAVGGRMPMKATRGATLGATGHDHESSPFWSVKLNLQYSKQMPIRAKNASEKRGFEA
jgi:hypothetical protein